MRHEQPLNFLTAVQSELNGVISLCCSQLKRHELNSEIHISADVMGRVRVLLHGLYNMQKIMPGLMQETHTTREA